MVLIDFGSFGNLEYFRKSLKSPIKPREDTYFQCKNVCVIIYIGRLELISNVTVFINFVVF